MSTTVGVSAFALWTPGGVWTNAAPVPGAPGPELASWPEAPALAQVHPRARRPHTQAVALVQLAHQLFSARAGATGGVPPAPPSREVDLLLGTVTGCAAADLDFLEGLKTRGEGFGSPSTFVYTLATAAPAEVALALGLRGALATVTAGGISGLASVARAAAHIAAGRSRACLCGGAELARLGSRRASGASEQDILALFLLEAMPEGAPWPQVQRWEVGFAPSERTAPECSPPAALLSLATAVARAGTEGTAQVVSGSSHEGHWARLSLASPGSR
ncbi:beta-ketoacyl synthase N-terminal-like domain-containing protein [Vitiosangium sp. GDMCC 1.1324]|uniref:beta-ketoacyl synthase N-terminal-like domain-containing protein n=1 Tax=Vitiosangium sp. (strain GDMCC 1.1324) TaxID=2138576 RepID=UPI00130DEAF5|nr:beta-ketoacyl synthase N-terminal-like domain-containing protein [Vitiosangium sp. GDMCC 1.1324]